MTPGRSHVARRSGGRRPGTWGDAEEAPLDAHGVGVDEDEVARLEPTIGGLRSPGIRVGTRADRRRSEVFATSADHHVREHGENSRSETPGAIAASNAASISITSPALRSNSSISSGVLTRRACWVTGAESTGRTPRSSSARNAGVPRRSTATRSGSHRARGPRRASRRPRSPPGAPGRRRTPRRASPARRGRAASSGGPSSRARTGSGSLLRHDGTAHERAHRVDGHRGDPCCVPNVGLVREDQGVDIVVAHRALQPGETPEAEPFQVDVVRHGNPIVRPIPRSSARS